MLRGHKHYRKSRVVSFGPIHHGKPAYQLAEEYKLMVAGKFIGKTGRTDEELYGIIEDNIKQLREYYDEKVTKKYSDEDLAWMLFVDGCATLQFIDSSVNRKVKDVNIKNDQVVFVSQDLFLLENQLPYRLLDDLMKNSIEKDNLRNSIQEFIDKQSILVKSGEKLQQKNDEETIHLLDLLRKRLLSVPLESRGNEKVPENGIDWHSFCNVQELKAAGIHLKPNYGASFLENITFVRNWKFYGGVLCLPRITVDESTGPMFLNLMAYENSSDFENDYGVTSYISFLNSLIDEAKDAMHLRQAGILRNLLGSDDEVAQVFNEIGTGLVPNFQIYRDVRYQIENYYSDKNVEIWISRALYIQLIQAYSGAVLGLTFSLVQMIYAILSYEYQRRH